MKKFFIYSIAVTAMLFALGGCGKQPVRTAESSQPAEPVAEETAQEAPAEEAETPAPAPDDVQVRVGSLKGPTSIGLVKLIHEQENNPYTFTMETQADVIIAGIASGDLDIALIPANVASVLYKKTNGGIVVIDINTLGVLYMVSGDDSISSWDDLTGKTIYTTGAGSTPEYVLRYLLSANGLSDSVKIEFKSEATEVAAQLAADPSCIGMLPQPFVTAALAQNDQLSIVMDMTKEWDALDNGSRLLTGVTVVRKEFLEEHRDAVNRFLSDHAESVAFVNSETETAAEYTAEAGIIEKAPVAQKAIPFCNIVCISGADMKNSLSGYLEILYEQDPASVGGELPADDFYGSIE